MNEMIERVARRLYGADSLRYDPRWDRMSEGLKAAYYTFAHAAITEMLEPTEEMARAGGIGVEDAAACWKRMIRAAISP